MISFPGGVARIRHLLSFLALALAVTRTVTPQSIVYDNTTTYLEQYETDSREYGDQVHLTGGDRNVVDFYFGFFGNFVPTGDERAKIRFYANDRPYDMFRDQPSTILWDSGYFPIDAGMQLKHLPVATPGSAVVVPDIFTFTVEFLGLAPNESAGLLLYDPPGTGSSFNEFWMRTGEDRFDVFQYPGGSPRASFYARVVAVPEPGVWTLCAAGLLLLACRGKFGRRQISSKV